MEKKEKNTFGKIPNRPYFVWIVIAHTITIQTGRTLFGL